MTKTITEIKRYMEHIDKCNRSTKVNKKILEYSLLKEERRLYEKYGNRNRQTINQIDRNDY